MIKQPELKIFEIPCKNKYSNTITIFEEIGYSFSDASQRLGYKLDLLKWIIGYGSM